MMTRYLIISLSVTIRQFLTGAEVESTSPDVSYHSQSSFDNSTSPLTLKSKQHHRNQIKIINFLSPTSPPFVQRQSRASLADHSAGSRQFTVDDISALIQLHNLMGFPDTDPKAPPFSKLAPVKDSPDDRRKYRHKKNPPPKKQKKLTPEQAYDML